MNLDIPADKSNNVPLGVKEASCGPARRVRTVGWEKAYLPNWPQLPPFDSNTVCARKPRFGRVLWSQDGFGLIGEDDGSVFCEEEWA